MDRLHWVTELPEVVCRIVCVCTHCGMSEPSVLSVYFQNGSVLLPSPKKLRNSVLNSILFCFEGCCCPRLRSPTSHVDYSGNFLVVEVWAWGSSVWSWADALALSRIIITLLGVALVTKQQPALSVQFFWHLSLTSPPTRHSRTARMHSWGRKVASSPASRLNSCHKPKFQQSENNRNYLGPWEALLYPEEMAQLSWEPCPYTLTCREQLSSWQHLTHTSSLRRFARGYRC
jgi:hypothetical protein